MGCHYDSHIAFAFFAALRRLFLIQQQHQTQQQQHAATPSQDFCCHSLHAQSPDNNIDTVSRHTPLRLITLHAAVF